MNLNNVDKILMKDKSELDKLMQWKDNNKELVRNYNPVLEEGLIIFEEYKQYFKQTENKVNYIVWFGDKEVMKLEILNCQGGYVVKNIWSIFHPEHQEMSIKDCVTTHYSLMAYMANYTEYVTEKRQRVIKKKKASSKSKKNNRVIKLGKRIYDVTIPQSVAMEKRSYKKHTEAFTVSGHYRTYKKTGKRVWIASYIKGNKEADRQPRTFKM